MSGDAVDDEADGSIAVEVRTGGAASRDAPAALSAGEIAGAWVSTQRTHNRTNAPTPNPITVGDFIQFRGEVGDTFTEWQAGPAQWLSP